jgi:guanosine-3',5'-bis(diphosphate) 3'-pyrophosphohydrolase
VLRAAWFAASKHIDQKRRDGVTPYINHPLEVSELLGCVGVRDPEILAAALLHDTIEDIGTAAEEIANEFGARVASLVSEVTDDSSLPKDVRKRRQIEMAARMTPAGKLIRLADKVCNLRSMAVFPPLGWPHERCVAYLDWSAEVAKGLVDCNPELAELFRQALEVARANICSGGERRRR